MTYQMKTCSKCKKERPAYHFHAEEAKAGGLAAWCKRCKGHGYRAYKERYRDCLIGSSKKGRRSKKSIAYVNSLLLKETVYKHPEKYKSKLIEYHDAPSGYAYIGVAKAPLMPNENGIGFQGVVLQDETRQLVQCSSCGLWAKIINTPHILKCWGGTKREYNEHFRLNLTEGLCADETSLRYSKTALKNKSGKNSAEWLESLRKRAMRAQSTKGQQKRTRQMENKHGTCPEQIKDSLYTFITSNREFPSQSNRGRKIYKTLYRRHGRVGHCYPKYGLPRLDRVGTNMKYSFSDGSVYEFNINKNDDRGLLWEMLKEKCPVLKDYLPSVQ